MAPESPSKIKVTQIPQVCLVVENLQKTIEDYWNILGIGPWTVFDFGSAQIPDFKHNGRPTWSTNKGALVQLGPIELELFEPTGGCSSYQDWLEEHGEGLHHMKFLAEGMDVDTLEKVMAGQGFPSIQSGHYGPDLKGQFSYFDMRKPLHAIWETSLRTGGELPFKVTRYPEDPKAVSPAKVKVSSIKQVGVVVKDVYETAHEMGMKVHMDGARVMNAAVAQGVRSFHLLPLFMASAGHVDKDIRPLVEELAQRFPETTIELLDAVGENPLFHGLIQNIANHTLS